MRPKPSVKRGTKSFEHPVPEASARVRFGHGLASTFKRHGTGGRFAPCGGVVMSTPYNFEMPNRVPLERAIADVKLPRKTIHEFMWMCANTPRGAHHYKHIHTSRLSQ